MNSQTDTLHTQTKSSRKNESNVLYFIPDRASSTNYKDIIAKNDFATTTHQAANGLRSDLFAKKTILKAEGRNHRNVSIAGERKSGKNEFRAKEDKKGVIAKKMQLYNTTQFSGKVSLLSILSSTVNREKLFGKNEQSQRGKNEKIIVPITLKFSSIEQHNTLKKQEESILKYLKMEVIAVQVQDYLTYTDFYHFMISSKQVFNQSLLLNAQINLIMKGLTKEMREQLWRDKCKITQGQAAYEEYYSTPTDCEYDITKDITRTFMPSHEFCRDPNNYKRLKRVLHAFAVKHPEIGYIQGLNFLAGNLILQFPEHVIVFWSNSLGFGYLKDFVQSINLMSYG
jgi:hypothetical protein